MASTCGRYCAAISKLAAAAASPDDLKLDLHVCLGGLPVAGDRAALSRGVQAIVGTPGRVRQLLEEGSLHPDGKGCHSRVSDWFTWTLAVISWCYLPYALRGLHSLPGVRLVTSTIPAVIN
jgi:hypothetical protein